VFNRSLHSNASTLYSVQSSNNHGSQDLEVGRSKVGELFCSCDRKVNRSFVPPLEHPEGFVARLSPHSIVAT